MVIKLVLLLKKDKSNKRKSLTASLGVACCQRFAKTSKNTLKKKTIKKKLETQEVRVKRKR